MVVVIVIGCCCCWLLLVVVAAVALQLYFVVFVLGLLGSKLGGTSQECSWCPESPMLGLEQTAPTIPHTVRPLTPARICDYLRSRAFGFDERSCNTV